MFRFASPYMLYLLLLIPVMAGLYVLALRARRGRIRRFGDPATVGRLMPDASPLRERNKFILLLCAIAFVIFALARPQFGSKLREQTSQGIEMMLVVDVSNSMLAQDFQPTRLEQTKYAVDRLLGDLKQDRVGLIVFAGEAYVQLPVTSDYATARRFAQQLSPGMVSRQGTALGAAIELAANSFSSQSENSRVIIVISDGENHEDDPLAAAEAAAARGITIYAIGIGTPEGALIPVDGEMLRDENGNMVVSKLDESMLQRVAVATGGTYIRASKQTLGLDEIVKKIRETDRKSITTTVFEEYDEQFQPLLVIAIALLIIETLLLNRKNRILSRFNVFQKPTR